MRGWQGGCILAILLTKEIAWSIQQCLPNPQTGSSIVNSSLLFLAGIAHCMLYHSVSDHPICTPGNEVLERITQEDGRATRKRLWRESRVCLMITKAWITTWGWRSSKLFVVFISWLIFTMYYFIHFITLLLFIIHFITFHFMYYYYFTHVLQNVRVKAPVELVQQLIRLTSRQTHKISYPLLTLFHFFSVSFAVTHPSIDRYFHSSGWNSDFYTPLPVTANSRSVRFSFLY